MARVLILLYILVISICAQAKLLFVSSVSRHGDREPLEIYNFTDNPEDNYQEPGMLTKKGMRQHYFLGREMRKRYIEEHKLVSKDFKNEETFFRSSNIKRTLESLKSQLVGLYPPKEECSVTLNHHQRKTAIPPFKIEGLEKTINELGASPLPDCYELPPVFSRHNDYDFKFAMHHSNCQIYNVISGERFRSREYQRLLSHYGNEIRPKFEKWTKNDSLTNNDIDSLCRYFTFGTFSGIPFNVDFTDEDYDICMKVIDQEMYYKVWGNDLLWKIGAKRYLESLIESMDKVAFKNSTQRLNINVGHDVSIMMILHGLGHTIKETPHFASVILFELWEDDDTGKLYVKTFYNDEPITYDMCSEEKCSYDTFKLNVHQRVLPGNIDDICDYNENLGSIDDLVKSDAFIEMPASLWS